MLRRYSGKAQRNSARPAAVCPENIKITDNALIPMKERVVGRKYDPLVWLGAKIARRPRRDTPAVPGKKSRAPWPA